VDPLAVLLIIISFLAFAGIMWKDPK